jgi:hypothetical protein
LGMGRYAAKGTADREENQDGNEFPHRHAAPSVTSLPHIPKKSRNGKGYGLRFCFAL